MISCRSIALVNHKGGVGKTTTTYNLGRALTLWGKRVLMIDLDPQANLSIWAGVEEPEISIYESLDEGRPLPILPVDEYLDLIPSSLGLSELELKLYSNPIEGVFILQEALQSLRSDYDFILIDCPPSLGILTINALVATDEVIVVVQSQYLSTAGLNSIYRLINKTVRKMKAGPHRNSILLTQLTHTVVSRSMVDFVRQTYGQAVFQQTIRQNIAVQEASAQQMDIFTYDARCHAAQDYRHLAEEILAYGPQEEGV